VFGDSPKSDPEPTVDAKTLHAKIGELTLENDYFGRRATHCAVSATGSNEPHRGLSASARK